MFSVPLKTFYSINACTAQHLLYLEGPSSEQVQKSSGPNLWIEPFSKIRILCGNSPVTLTGITLLAKVTPHCYERRSTYICRIGTQCYCFHHIRTGTYTSGSDNRGLMPYSLFP